MSTYKKAAKSFGARVRVLRDRYGLTQVQLADASGLDQSIISRIENGRYPVTIENLYQLRDGFDCPLSSLVKGLPE